MTQAGSHAPRGPARVTAAAVPALSTGNPRTEPTSCPWCAGKATIAAGGGGGGRSRRKRDPHPDIPEGTTCAGGLQKRGTKRTLCDRLAVAIRPRDGAFVCAFHEAGAGAIRDGGAFNDNGRPHFVYLNSVDVKKGEYKVGRSQNPRRRRARGEFVKDHQVPLKPYPTESWASIAEAVEHALRVRLALDLGADVPITGKESVHTDDVDHKAVVATFDRLFPQVCKFIMRSSPSQK